MPQSPLISVSLDPETRSVRPGERAEFIITVQNTGTEAHAQSVELAGLPDAWYRINYDASEQAAPGETRSGTLVVTVPLNVSGQTYDFDISVLSGSAESTVSGSIQVSSALPEPPAFEDEAPAVEEAPPPAAAAGDAVAPVVSLEAGLVIWRGGGQTPERKELTIRNPGGSQAEYVIEVEGLESTWYTVLNRIRVAAGEELRTDFTIHPPSGAREQDYPYRIYVGVDGSQDLRTEALGWLSVPRTSGTAQQEAPATTATAPAQPERPRTTPSGERATPPDVAIAPRANFRFTQSEPVAQAVVTVTNRGRVRERFTLAISGIPEDWYRLSDDTVRLDPGEARQISLRLTPVTGAGLPAGEYEFLVRALPEGMPDYYGEALGVLSISGIAKYEARLEPLQAQGLRRDFNVRVENTGDMAVRIAVQASDPENRCKFKVPDPRDIEPGQIGLIQIKVGAKRNGIVGPPETFDFRLGLEDAESDAQADRDLFDGRFIHQPRLGFRTVFVAAFMAALVGVVILMVWLLTPAFEDAANWVGCQMDDNYRLSADHNPVKKEVCDGNPRDQELDQWQQERQSSAGAYDLEGSTLVYPEAWRDGHKMAERRG